RGSRVKGGRVLRTPGRSADRPNGGRPLLAAPVCAGASPGKTRMAPLSHPLDIDEFATHNCGSMAGRRREREPIAATIVRRLGAGDVRGEAAMTRDRLAATYQPYVLSLFRFITGLLLFQYGVAKIFKFPALSYFANPPPLIMTAGGLELVLGGLLIIGLFTRPVAFVLSGEMAFA